MVSVFVSVTNMTSVNYQYSWQAQQRSPGRYFQESSDFHTKWILECKQHSWLAPEKSVISLSLLPPPQNVHIVFALNGEEHSWVKIINSTGLCDTGYVIVTTCNGGGSDFWFYHFLSRVFEEVVDLHFVCLIMYNLEITVKLTQDPSKQCNYLKKPLVFFFSLYRIWCILKIAISSHSFIFPGQETYTHCMCATELAFIKTVYCELFWWKSYQRPGKLGHVWSSWMRAWRLV